MPVIERPKTRERQQHLGQFLTPEPIAHFMASLFDELPATLRLLDPGAGAGALTWALVNECVQNHPTVRTIDATAYEVDPMISGALEATMRRCQTLCVASGVEFRSSIQVGDFIEDMSCRLAGDLFGLEPPSFDAVITNPPYRKIHSASPERRALQRLGIETSNLYAGFLSLAQRLLVPGGQMVAITPRSFCNGPYFLPFRAELLRVTALRRLHVFESRRAAFRKDAVLQENIVLHVQKSTKQTETVRVSSSSGEPGAGLTDVLLPYREIVHPNDPARFIHIPSTRTHAVAREALETLETSLADLGITVSTGRVIDFRVRDALRMEPGADTAPLIYPSHFHRGTVTWPKRDGRKPNAILDTPETAPWLVPGGIYLLTKRFTSKEEKRRLVACIFDPERVPGERIGFENHLNYFHVGGRGLERTFAKGLFAFLNSSVVDDYFRRFSGHTQVNATDLRNLRYPDRETLLDIGRALDSTEADQSDLDALIHRHLHARGKITS